MPDFRNMAGNLVGLKERRNETCLRNYFSAWQTSSPRRALKKYEVYHSMSKCISSSGMAHGSSPTARTDADIIVPDCFQDIRHGHICQHGLEFLMPLKPENNGQVFLFAAVIQKPIITDFTEAGRQHMHHKAAYKFPAGNQMDINGCRM